MIFLPSISTEEKESLLARCLCVIYTPTDEHFGIVPLEAMAAAKPVVACCSGGPVESVVDGVTGILCASVPEVGKSFIPTATLFNSSNLLFCAVAGVCSCHGTNQ